MKRVRITDLALVGAGWIAIALTFGPTDALRAVAVFLFTFIAPGLAIVDLIGMRDALERFVLAVATSLALATVVTEAFSLPHEFTARSSLLTLSCITTLAVILRLVTVFKPARRHSVIRTSFDQMPQGADR